MKQNPSLAKLSLAVALLAGSHAAQAITPWTTGNEVPDYTIYTSGGAAQDTALLKSIENELATNAANVTIFTDNASSPAFTAYYFNAKAGIPNVATGAKVLLIKRSLGAAGYGVVPLAAGIPLWELNPTLTATSRTAANWTTSDGGKTYVHALASNDTNYLENKVSDAGVIGVDAAALLKPGTENYPAPVNEKNGLPTVGWDYSRKLDNLKAGYSSVPTGGFVYGIEVTLDLYKVLQAAQIKSGQLPASTVIGAYDEASLPSLNRNFLAAVLSGKISNWSDVKVVDKTTGLAVPVTDDSILSTAGITGSIASATGHTAAAGTIPFDERIAVGRRNTGAAIGAVAYAKILNYPYAGGAFPPAAAIPNDSAAGSDEDVTWPIVKAPAGAGDTDKLLVDWQTGTNSSGFNNQPDSADTTKKRRFWGIAVQGGDRNVDASKAIRYIKIDGFAPTLRNVAAGDYPYWAEGEIWIAKGLPAAQKSILTTWANGLGKAINASEVNAALNPASPTKNQPWGHTGVFATSKTEPGLTVTIPFNINQPVIGLTHSNGALATDPVSLGAVPAPYYNNSGSTSIELR